MRRARFALLALFVSLTAHACGDSEEHGDGPMCGDTPNCGGKLEGSWKLSEGCYVVLEQPKLEFCPSAIAELHATKVEGNITFEKDVYERHVEIETELLLKLPTKCLEQDGEKNECTSFSTRLSNGATLACADADKAADGCECSASLTSTGNDSGPFTIRGNRVELVGETLDYCVKGDTLTLRPSESIKTSGVAVTSQLQTTFEKN